MECSKKSWTPWLDRKQAARMAQNAVQKGMTLIEIIIVVALLGSIMTILFSNIQSKAARAKEDQARIGMGGLTQNLQLYRVHNNKYPTTAQGLEALVKDPGETKHWRGPYTESDKLKDPWDNEYKYTSDGRQFEILSGGIDGIIGDEDDIKYPPETKDEGGASASGGAAPSSQE